MKDLLDDQTVDGVLNRWLDWWPEDALSEILPNPADRDLLASDMPRLPRSFYEDPIDVPVDWSEGPCGYLRLSKAYDTEFAEARARNWPTVTVDSTHLEAHTEPGRVLRELLRLVDQIDEPDRRDISSRDSS